MHPDEYAFIVSICATPADDTARLVFADWLEEHAQGERAEFIRVQCELSRMPRRLTVAEPCALTTSGSNYWLAPGGARVQEGQVMMLADAAPGDRIDILKPETRRRRNAPPLFGLRLSKFTSDDDEGDAVLVRDEQSGPDAAKPLHRRERELLSIDTAYRWFQVDGLATYSGKVGGPFEGWLCRRDGGAEVELQAITSRGFVSHVTCTSADWLRFADSLAWHPEKSRDACSECKGRGKVYYGGGGDPEYDPDCRDCNGTGTIPRPCPGTAQPITHVTITDPPGGEVSAIRNARNWRVTPQLGIDMKDHYRREWDWIAFDFR